MLQSTGEFEATVEVR